MFRPALKARTSPKPRTGKTAKKPARRPIFDPGRPRDPLQDGRNQADDEPDQEIDGRDAVDRPTAPGLAPIPQSDETGEMPLDGEGDGDEDPGRGQGFRREREAGGFSRSASPEEMDDGRGQPTEQHPDAGDKEGNRPQAQGAQDRLFVTIKSAPDAGRFDDPGRGPEGQGKPHHPAERPPFHAVHVAYVGGEEEGDRQEQESLGSFAFEAAEGEVSQPQKNDGGGQDREFDLAHPVQESARGRRELGSGVVRVHAVRSDFPILLIVLRPVNASFALSYAKARARFA